MAESRSLVAALIGALRPGTLDRLGLFRENLREALRGLRRTTPAGRMALAGVVAGAAMLVAAINMGRAGEVQSNRQFQALQPDLWLLQGSAGLTGAPTSLSPTVIASLVGNCRGITAATVIERRDEPVGEGRQRGPEADRVTVIRMRPELRHALDLRLAQGRWLTPMDAQERHVLLGSALAARIQRMPASEVTGGRVLLNGWAYQVVGVLAPVAAPDVLRFDINQTAFVSARLPGHAESVDTAVVRVTPQTTLEGFRSELQRCWPDLGRPPPTPSAPTSLHSAMTGQTATLSWLSLAQALAAMTLGALAIASQLFAEVRYRRQEIGLRMALGARRGDVLTMFLTEAAAMGACGGLLGVLLGDAASLALQHAGALPLTVSPTGMVLALATSVAVALMAAAVPAWRASRLPPVQALRS